MSTDPQNHRAIYDQVVAAGPAGATVGAIRLALTGDWRLQSKRDKDRQVIPSALGMLEKRGCVRKVGTVICKLSLRHSARYVVVGPFVSCENRPPQVKNNQHTKGRRDPDELPPLPIARELEPIVNRLRHRFVPVAPAGRGRWTVGRLEVDTADMVALDRGDVSVAELMGL